MQTNDYDVRLRVDFLHLGSSFMDVPGLYSVVAWDSGQRRHDLQQNPDVCIVILCTASLFVTMASICYDAT